MKTKSSLANTPNSKTMSGHLRVACATRLLPLLLLMLPAAVQAQFNFVINNGTITITRYTGSGGAVDIPATINGLPVSSIEWNAFNSCTSLTSVTIPNSVTSIGDGAFLYCTNLTSVIIGNGVTSIGNWAFEGCTHLTAVTIGNSVTNIGEETFMNCTSLTSVTIPNSVIIIENWAFEGCTSLTSVTIPNSVTSVESGSFARCTSLTTITVDALNSVYSSMDGVLFDKSQTTLILCPAGKAGNYTIPDSVTSIGNGAFAWGISLTSVTIPDSVSTIENNAFAACTSLTSVVIPNSVTNIGDWAFSWCASLANITIGTNVTSIGDGAFYNCTRLTNVTIGNSVTSIGDRAFNYCSNLTSITIPDSVTTIGDWTFQYCTNLRGVYFQGNAPSVGLDVFYDANKANVYYLPGTTGWEATLGGRPTALWVLPNPLILNTSPSFGAQTNGFGFVISWATNTSVVVEASTNLANPIWSPVSTNMLAEGWSYFSDPDWTNYPSRFYRIRSP